MQYNNTDKVLSQLEKTLKVLYNNNTIKTCFSHREYTF